MSDMALEVSGLGKSFGAFRAVQQLDLALPYGRFEAFLGANGAGKTTSMRMIAGLTTPSTGSIKVCGHDMAQAPLAAKAHMAFLPDEPLIYERMTPWEYLELLAGLWQVDSHTATQQADDLLRRLDLWNHRHERMAGFSRGMKQKTALAGALLHQPKLLLMDEPFSGLDAAIAREVKDILSERQRAGATILLTTHVMEIAERLAEHITIINKGQIVARGTLDSLRADAGQPEATLESIFLGLIDGPNSGG